jgi:hypoxanthine phosphoribosyltransferase
VNARVFDHERVLRLRHAHLRRAAELLADAADRGHGPLARVIAIANGGLIPAAAIAAHLGIPVRVVIARHNLTAAPYTPATGQVGYCTIGVSAADLTGKILLVDDIYGTGATVTTVHAALAALAPAPLRAVTATLCVNAGAQTRPDLWIWDGLRDWVHFFWEDPPDTPLPHRDLPAPQKAFTL